MNYSYRLFIKGWFAIGFIGLEVSAAAIGVEGSPPNLDSRDRPPQDSLLTPEKKQALDRLNAAISDVHVQWHPVSGTPQFIQRGFGQYLTEPFPADPSGPADPDAAIKKFLKEHRDLFGHGAEVLDAARVVRDYTTAHNGVRTVEWEQQLAGVPVYEARFVTHVTPSNQLLSVASRFLPDVPGAAARGMNGRTEPDQWQLIPPEKALEIGITSVGASISARQLIVVASAEGPDRRQAFESPELVGEAVTRLVWLPLNPGSMRVCWWTYFITRVPADGFESVVDAETGFVYLRRSMSAPVGDASYLVFPSDSPSPFSPGHSSVSSGQPLFVSRVLTTEASVRNPSASPNGWIYDGTNETRGNNVDAFLDRNGNGAPDVPRPSGSPTRVFQPALDLGNDPSQYSAASVVNLFYWCNWMHDKLYSYGFTRAARNLEGSNNYLIAQAQYGADLVPGAFNSSHYRPDITS